MALIETRKLQQFLVLAEELNFHRAAERLHMAQPPLSMAIRQLEGSIGVQLFDRGRTYVRLTPAGQVFLREAHRILSSIENASRLAKRAHEGVIGSVRISFVPSAGYAFIPGLLRSFAESYPDVELHLSEGFTSEVLRAVSVGDADVGFVRQTLGPQIELEHFVCEEEPLYAVLPVGHPAASRQRLPLFRLKDEDFIVINGMRAPAFRASVIDACHSAGFAPKVRHEASTIATMIGLVGKGLGVTLVQKSANVLQHANVRFYRLSDVSTSIQLLAVWKRANEDSVVESFLSRLRAGTAARGGR